MPSINRVDQTVLLLKERLRRMQERTANSAASARETGSADRTDNLAPLRQLAKHNALNDHDLRRALVRTLLADAFGDHLSASIEFKFIVDRVTRIIEEDEAGRELMSAAIRELD